MSDFSEDFLISGNFARNFLFSGNSALHKTIGKHFLSRNFKAFQESLTILSNISDIKLRNLICGHLYGHGRLLEWILYSPNSHIIFKMLPYDLIQI